ncbi:serine protease [Streptomyces sp. Ag109_G2-15]|uniref:serine protease n=1 Tax=Streptomyces sp. Ag109_G2-15 TaxID=1938850 RepID=UPI000BC8665F|nr:serine protease [Streptomyces sp. Ag109_G2-15]SOE06466.1 hypothetical protein SAMN06272765_7280 [Streptomyces sp. Ag109_G2-15]
MNFRYIPPVPFVLTALHCLRGLTALDADLNIVLPDGSSVAGHVCRQDKDADLALIKISAEFKGSLPMPGLARGGDRWRGPYRPAKNEVELSGHISSGAVQYLCEGGASIEALQLTPDQRLGDYSGYSGGPVEGLAPDRTPAVVGILLEQAPDRADASRSANVLFAATMNEVMGRFDVFDAAHLIDVLRPDGTEQAEKPARQEHAAKDPSADAPSLRSQTDRVESVLDIFQQLSSLKVLAPSLVAELRYRALKHIIDEDPDGGAA